MVTDVDHRLIIADLMAQLRLHTARTRDRSVCQEDRKGVS